MSLSTRPSYPDGKIMLEKSIEGLDLNYFDKVIITIVKEHAEKFFADKILEDIFHFQTSEKFHLCILDDFTSCQAETIHKTLKLCDVTGDFAVKDSDNYIKISIPCLEKRNFVTGINIETFPHEIRRLGSKSFITVNEQNVILDIIEKKIKSGNISVGLYGFDDAELFHGAYLHLNSTSVPHHEIYLSHIISYLIGIGQAIYQYLEAEDYEDWGTIQDWDIVLKKKSSIIILADELLFHCDKENFITPINENLNAIKKLYDEGAQIIVMTSLPNEFKSLINPLC
ncbi:MAG: hypothetical protein IKZ58_05730 [Selenomonadaceae bacterium]|nr:hypothetical protein [Selenomonadaceae bacterium]